MPTISVIVITKNEASLIANCLESVKWADEIIVIDSGSTDNTVEIARKYTPHVYITEDWPGYGIQKQRALEKATGDWVLNIDADEEVTEALKTALLDVACNTFVDACQIPIKMVFYEKLLKYSWCPSRHIRFYRRKNAHYTQAIVHEEIQLPEQSNIIQLKAFLKHYCFRDFYHALYKLNRYSSQTARIRREKGKTSSISKALFSFAWMFFRCYILQKGILDGKPGLLLAILSAQSAFYRNIKQIYHEEKLDDFSMVR